MVMINTICFDLDGTLVDSEMVILKSFDHVFSEYLPKNRMELLEYRQFMGPTLKETYLRYTNDSELIQEMIQSFVDYYKTIELGIIKLFPTVQNTLEELAKHHYNICLITNKFTSSAMPSITYLNIKQYFNDFVTLDRQEKPKPSGFPIELAARDYRVSLDNILMVGDNSVDMLSAKDAGVKSILVNWNSWFKETLKLKPDYVIQKMSDLLDIIKIENGGSL